ncbi:IS256 family transposase ISBsu2 [bioreactor metagenome]|uniref:IS256 family transposase ISBsu2 n=1 Tax=bioreactor metagenome TaxID=1076179 RepID=A0A645CX93_9ZZZZ
MTREKRDPRREELLREMIGMYHPQSVEDIQNMLKDMFADTMENMLKAELDTELGYKKNDQREKLTTNRRNGSYSKTVQSHLGESEIQIPRDREGSYEPKLVPNGTKDVSALEEKILSLYAKGTSDRDISDVINEIYGFELSHETISNIVDRVQPRVIEWQNRRLDKVYPFVYMDALMISLKSVSDGHTDKKAGKYAVYSMIGINCDGKKDCFGFWIGANEGTHQWLSIFDELKARGVERLGFVCIDGLSGLEEAITNTFSEAIVCRCMVHLVRNSTKYIPTKRRKEFCADLKAIYGAISAGEAESALSQLNEKWQKQYPSAVKVWNDNFCYVQRLFEYPAEIRKMIYTTNTIESFNSALRKVTDRKGAFPNEAAILKILYLRTLDIAAKWTKPYPNWSVVRGKLDILFGDGWDR